uniref:Uncharacterized protein n=1 Tax=Anguilla anguilla TaxID=7936 RepID=A0A0E9TGH9_ANGAN
MFVLVPNKFKRKSAYIKNPPSGTQVNQYHKYLHMQMKQCQSSLC